MPGIVDQNAAGVDIVGDVDRRIAVRRHCGHNPLAQGSNPRGRFLPCRGHRLERMDEVTAGGVHEPRLTGEAYFELLDRFVDGDGDWARAEADLDETHPFHEPGLGVPSWALIEVFAQTAALMNGKTTAEAEAELQSNGVEGDRLALLAAHRLAHHLQAAGVEIGKPPATGEQEPEHEWVRHESVPLVEIIRSLHRTSNNLEAEAIFRMIGVHLKSKSPHGAKTRDQAMRLAIANRRKQLAQAIWLRTRGKRMIWPPRIPAY